MSLAIKAGIPRFARNDTLMSLPRQEVRNDTFSGFPRHSVPRNINLDIIIDYTLSLRESGTNMGTHTVYVPAFFRERGNPNRRVIPSEARNLRFCRERHKRRLPRQEARNGHNTGKMLVDASVTISKT